MMSKKNDVASFFSLIVCIIPFIISIIFYKSLPEVVATHWDLNGNPNGYFPRFIAAFAVPTLILIGHIFVQFILKNKKEEKYAPAMEIISIWLAPLLSLVVQSVIILNAIGTNIRWEMSVYIIVGLIFVFIGNYLPKSKPNNIAGIKFPWIMKSEKNWVRTNRFTGYVWIVDGLLIIIAGLFKLEWVFFSAFIVLIGAPVIYSIIISKGMSR